MLVEVQVCQWVVQEASGTQADQCVLQANSQPSLHNFPPVGHQVTCSHQPGYYCMFLTIELQTSYAIMTQYHVELLMYQHGH